MIEAYEHHFKWAVSSFGGFTLTIIPHSLLGFSLDYRDSDEQRWRVHNPSDEHHPPLRFQTTSYQRVSLKQTEESKWWVYLLYTILPWSFFKPGLRGRQKQSQQNTIIQIFPDCVLLLFKVSLDLSNIRFNVCFTAVRHLYNYIFIFVACASTTCVSMLYVCGRGTPSEGMLAFADHLHALKPLQQTTRKREPQPA